MLQRITAGAAGLLGLFHAWLLGSQWWDGQLAEPGLVLRWLAAAGLLLAIVLLRRSGASVFLGRKAVAIWLLAMLLHGPAIARQHERGEWAALPEAVIAVVQVAAASVALGCGLALLAALGARQLAIYRARYHTFSALAFQALDVDRLVRFAPRPPPTHA
jgi:hypothetical protein